MARADLRVDAEAFAAAFHAFRAEYFAVAAARLGAILRPHAPLPSYLAAPLPHAGPPPVPAPTLAALRRQRGPWHLVRDPVTPRLGDAAVLAGVTLHFAGALTDLRTWAVTVRRRGLVWPDEPRPDVDLGCADIREGLLHAGRARLERILRDWPDLTVARRAHLLYNLALTMSQLGEWRRARDLMHESVALVRVSGADWDLGKMLVGLGLLETRSFRAREGEMLLREAVNVLERQGQTRYAHHARSNLAIALYKQGRVREAADLVDACQPALRRLGDRQSWVQATLVRCKVWLVAGDGRRALPVAVAMTADARRHGFRREHGLAVEMHGDAAVLLGDLDTAARCYGRAARMARQEAPAGDLAAGLARRLAQVTLLRGDVRAAAVALRDAEVLGGAAGEVFEQVVSGRLLAGALTALGDGDAARAAVRRAVDTARVHGCDLELARALLAGARAEALLVRRGASGMREAAWSHAAEARAILGRLGFVEEREGCDRFLARLREDWRAAWVWSGGPPPPESLDAGAAPAFVAASPAMAAAARQMSLAAASADPVLVTGETGTGKEVAACRIHALGPRRRAPLVAVNCAAVPPELFEREFFGHAPGAFSGAAEGARGLVEQADGGTLFLDEVGDLPRGLQAKLLRLLQEGAYRRVGDPAERRVDVRVIAATNVDLDARLARGEFRRDLYFRLSVLEVWLPPLRDREGDVVGLVRAFARVGLGDGVAPSDVLPPAVLAACAEYDWPGNVRELEALVRRACLYRRSGRGFSVGLLPAGLREVVEEREVADVSGGDDRGGSGSGDEGERDAGVAGGSDGRAVDYRLSARLLAAERAAVREALAAAGGNRTRAAELLGVSRKALYAKLARLGLGRAADGFGTAAAEGREGG